MKGWKTATVAAAIGLLGLVQTFLTQVEIDPRTSGVILTVIGVLMGGLRAITNTPIGKAE